MIDAHITALPGRPSSSDLDPDLRARLPIDVTDPPDEAKCFRAATTLGASTVNVTHYLGHPLPVDVMAEALAGVCQRARALGPPDLPGVLPGLRVARHALCPISRRGLWRGERLAPARRVPPRSFGRLGGRHPPPSPGQRSPGSSSATGEGRHPGRRTCRSEVGCYRAKASSRCDELVEAALENSPAATLDIEVLNEKLRNLPPDQAAARLAAAATGWRAGMS